MSGAVAPIVAQRRLSIGLSVACVDCHWRRGGCGTALWDHLETEEACCAGELRQAPEAAAHGRDGD